MNLNNKLAVITGISKGIGKAIALTLLDKGCSVMGWGLTPPDYQHSNLHFEECNVRSFESVQSAFGKFEKAFDKPADILINNAGLGYFGLTENIDIDELHQIFETNVYGTFYTCKLLIPGMKQQKSGHIINISSTAGLEGNPQIGMYAASKFAVRGFTQSLFNELREFKVKTTCVYPGSVRTDFFNNAPGVTPHANMMSADEVAQNIIFVLETTDNFNINNLEFRPLIARPE